MLVILKRITLQQWEATQFGVEFLIFERKIPMYQEQCNHLRILRCAKHVLTWCRFLKKKKKIGPVLFSLHDLTPDEKNKAGLYCDVPGTAVMHNNTTYGRYQSGSRGKLCVWSKNRRHCYLRGDAVQPTEQRANRTISQAQRSKTRAHRARRVGSGISILCTSYKVSRYFAIS